MAGIGEVWNGTYEHVAINWANPPVVLDIGANCGAFALRAACNWNAPKVYCYEPVPETFKFLEGNLGPFHQFELFNVAVGNPALNTMNISEGPLRSFLELDSPKEKSINVTVLDPAMLPFANAVKIDTEGAEGYICERLPFVPDYLAVECHSEELRLQVMNALAGKMSLLECRINALGLSILKWVKK